MKRKSLLFIVLIFLSLTIVEAQESTFGKGDKVINLGIGIGSTLYTGSGYTNKFPPVSASFEYCIKDGIAKKGSIGVGGYVGYTSAKWKYTIGGDEWGWKYTNIIVGARGTFHYPLLEKLDTYGGLLIGYDIISSKEFGTFGTSYYGSADASSPIWSMFIGGRYYFNDNIAGMVELGYGIAYLNLGVAFKF